MQLHSLLSVALAFVLRLLDHCLPPSNHHPWSSLPTINTEHPRRYHHLLLLDISAEQLGEHLVALVSAVPVDAVGDEGLRHGTEALVRYQQDSAQPPSPEAWEDIAYLGNIVECRTSGFLPHELLNLAVEPAPLAFFVGLMVVRVSRPLGWSGW